MSLAKILIVDDEPDMRDMLNRWLIEKGYETEQAADGREAQAKVSKTSYTAILLDLKLPDVDGMELLEIFHRDYPDICVIVLTGYGNDELLEKARQVGAFDFFAKEDNFEYLIDRVDSAIQRFRLHRENVYQLEEAKQKYELENMIGKSEVMQRMFDLVERVAEAEETILIQGESGTGKELVARAIHFHSRRNENPLIVADCAALSETLSESELFGHEKGAFTGAINRKIGKFERANNGTLFLDEIGKLPRTIQPKFLRFLQGGTFERVGGKESIAVNVRVIAATNVDLIEAIQKEQFIPDLYYRLNTIQIKVPPLRERKGDIPLLIDHFIKECNHRNGKLIKGISPAALRLLEDYHFPGNVRELEHIITNAVLLEESEVIKPETIRPRLAATDARSQLDFKDMSYREAKKVFERAYYAQLYEACHYNASETARRAGMDRSHVENRLKALGLKSPKQQNGSSPDDETH